MPLSSSLQCNLGCSNGMVGVGGFPYLKITKSKFQSVKVSCFQSSEESKTFNICCEILTPNHQVPISCFLEYIDPTFTILKKIKAGSFPNVSTFGFHYFEIYKNNMCCKCFVFSIYLEYPGFRKIKVIAFWEPWTRP